MIKVRLFTREEMIETRSIGEKKEVYVIYTEDYFEYNYCVKDLKDGEKPFRDAESIKLLKETYGITFADDADWFSVICDDERMPIERLNDSLKFALTAIQCSRRGTYTWYVPCEDKIWQLLADMPMDILVAAEIEKIGFWMPFIRGIDYKIVNYPLYNERVEVNVLQRFDKSDVFYTKVSEKKYSPEEDLYLRGDGKYYIDSWDMDFSLQYYWQNDILNIMEYLVSLKVDRPYIVDIKQEYSYIDFCRIFFKDEYDYPDEYSQTLANLKGMLKSGFLSEEGYAEMVEEQKRSEAYQKYDYLTNKVRIISYMVRVPEEPIARRPVFMYVDKNKDGTYLVYGNTSSVKYPEFNEIFEEIDYREDIEWQSILIVDMNELLEKAEDLDNTLYGFKVSRGIIEVYDKYEAMQMFGEILKEAYNSGKCSVKIYDGCEEEVYKIP